MASNTTLVTTPQNEFQALYSDFIAYPTNMVRKSLHKVALKGYRTRLDLSSQRLFHPREIYVPFRDFSGIGENGGLGKHISLNDESLRNWLVGENISTMKRDPKCRFIFLHSDSSRSPLKISRDMLLRILSFHEVMPIFLDFISVFGSSNETRDLRFSGFQGQTNIEMHQGAIVSPVVRSGRRFQMTYNLKAVVCKSKILVPLDQQQWSIRQAVIHHQFDVAEGSALWILAQAHGTLKSEVEKLTAVHGEAEDRDFSTPRGCFLTTLTVHILCCHWSIEEWRWYIQWLEEVIDTTNSAIYGEVSRGNIYKPYDIQRVQLFEDKINEAIMILETNATVILSLRDYYSQLASHADFDLRITCQRHITEFKAQLDNMVYDSRMQISRAKLLGKIAADRKNLIEHHLQAQVTKNMEDLTQLTIRIGLMSQREAIAMRIITVVTLVYLPATFVSTFFSTDIVSYQDSGSGSVNGGSESAYMGSFSQIAMWRWLQVTLPLTALTLAVGWVAFIKSGQKADKEFSLALLPLHSIPSKT